ncbi:MAG: alpha/beta hydrolase [Suipraeoptans sp.]
MALKKGTKKILSALSEDEVKIEATRSLASLKALTPSKIFHKTINYKVYNGNHAVPVRLFFPGAKTVNKDFELSINSPLLLFFHGGGWSTETVDSYERICAKIAESTQNIVASVEYRLAPEHTFPIGLTDCYAVAKEIYDKKFIINIKPENVTLIGDSAGGNLAAAVSLMARDKEDFYPARQILLYPSLYGDYTEDSPYASVAENGSDYILTRGRLLDYIDMYTAHNSDKNSPYFAPLKAKDFTNLPKTLIITSEFDPLRDEGEDYARILNENGNYAEVHRLSDAVHGFLTLGNLSPHVKESHELINVFLSKM